MQDLMNVRLIGSSVLECISAQLFVGMDQGEFQRHCQRNGHPSHDEHQDERQSVSRLIGLNEEEGSEKVADLSQDVVGGHTDGTLLWGLSEDTSLRTRGVSHCLFTKVFGATGCLWKNETCPRASESAKI